MGILTDILSSIVVTTVEIAIAGGGALARIGADIVAEARPRITAAVRAAREDWDRSQAARAPRCRSSTAVRAYRAQHHRSPAALQSELCDVNDRLRFLGVRSAFRALNTSERAQKKELVRERGTLIGELRTTDEFRIAEYIADDHNGEYDAVTVSDATTHLLQSTVGQTYYGKPCPICKWQMQLQWDRKNAAIGAKGFGWGCTGWYWRKNGSAHRCTHWEPLANDDYKVFARARRPEFLELDATQFAGLVLGHQHHVVKRMDAVRGEKDLHPAASAYRCPVHGEPLTLRKKREHFGRLLDMYFLGCPRWRADDVGCPYIVKLKSPAQLHAYLEASTGEGVI